jgi:hypothetical protein
VQPGKAAGAPLPIAGSRRSPTPPNFSRFSSQFAFLLAPAEYSYTGWTRSGALRSFPHAVRVLVSLSPWGEREGRGGLLAPPRASGCALPLPSTPLARCVPPLLDPLPRRGRGMRKRGCATRLPAAMQRPGAREGLRDPSRAVLAGRRLARPACRDRAAQAGQRERNATAKAVSIPAAMQWLVRAPLPSFPRAVPPLLSSSRAMRVLVSLSPWGEREG